MRLRCFRKFRNFLPLGAVVLFALQLLVAVPQHSFHGVELAASGALTLDERAPAQAEEGRCDFCIAFRGLDSASTLLPPAEILPESIFSIFAPYTSFEYSFPHLFALARGPPLV